MVLRHAKEQDSRIPKGVSDFVRSKDKGKARPGVVQERIRKGIRIE